jgi:carbamoyltransferase
MNFGEPPPILAFNDPYHDSSFCMYGHAGVVHVEMERFSRVKYETKNPIIGFCELYPELTDRFPCIAIEEGDFLAPLVRRLLSHGHDLAYDAVALAELVTSASAPPLRGGGASLQHGTPAGDALQAFCHYLSYHKPRIYFCGHHEAHAANAFFSSGLRSALTVTLDGGGYDYSDEGRQPERRIEIYGGVYDCVETSIRRVSYLRDTSFGLAWHRVTALLGLSWGEEGTVMAMAALGDPDRFKALCDEPLLWAPHDPWLAPAMAEALGRFLAAAREQFRSEQDCYDMAASLQAATERRVEAYLRGVIRDDLRNLCLSGGTFLNCQLAGKLQRWFPQLDTIFIPPAPYDGGISVGAAQVVLHQTLGFPPRSERGNLAPFAMGRSYSRSDVLSACHRNGQTAHPAGDLEVLELLDGGKICGLFSGAAESGRRALGHRSIIADPRRVGTKERINNEIKHRQWFRPLAPMVLAEHVGEWFECTERFASPYMSFAIPIKPGLPERVPAIVHLDGSARVQTVHRELSPVIHEFLSQWHRRSNVPMLVNTSFNDREPIVETPADALNTFQRVGIDAVYFADFGLLVSKGPAALGVR